MGGRLALCSRPRAVVCETVCAISSVPRRPPADGLPHSRIELWPERSASSTLLRLRVAGLSDGLDAEDGGFAAAAPLPVVVFECRFRQAELPRRAGAERFWPAENGALALPSAAEVPDVPWRDGSGAAPAAVDLLIPVRVPGPQPEADLSLAVAPGVPAEEERPREPAWRFLHRVLPGSDRTRNTGTVSSHPGRCDDKRCR